MKSLRDVEIVSERLKQVPITLVYCEAIFREFTSEITTYMYPQPSEDIRGIKAFVESSKEGIEAGTNLQLVILDKETGDFLGCSGLHHLDSNAPELGIWLKKSAHRHGFGLEAIQAIIAWAKENVVFDYLKYPVDQNNSASKRIPELQGGILTKAYKHKNTIGKELDIVEYWIYK